MATYAIGDVQGCYASLIALTKTIRFNPNHDQLWFVGDLVNRGPDSLNVLRYIRGLGSAAVTVLGNHDLFLLAVAAGITPVRASDTLTQILDAPDCDELMAWLRQQPLLYRQDSFLMLHAGLLPDWTVEQAEGLACEAQAALGGDQCVATLRALHPSGLLQWSRDLTGPTRLATIIKVLTRIRTCSAEGAMESSFSGPPELTPEGFHPWFDIPGRCSASSTVIFGHWAAMGLKIAPNLLGLDSGCVYGRLLTAVRLEDRTVFQVRCEAADRRDSAARYG
ncbi:MAG: symmetrical bis(5'-nucleosyl)-tetraphosphatase [Nitrospira sp.]|nr:symmetrical bis(5'-nucleosyl)-tetraphosphatase [Nitrospira sp.]MCW5785939.1 symmetrical bis(5'-nucleosyl)-tetraphosphatase [Nitrospira sp.]MDR4475411.1 symmetrical bis(5'-nucleosyl)-tetraphosphatase [Nitrospira sp.]